MEIRPLAHVRGGRAERLDDEWDSIVSVIELDASRFTPDALLGLDQFSHVEVVFHFDRVAEPGLKEQARHPRGETREPQWAREIMAGYWKK